MKYRTIFIAYFGCMICFISAVLTANFSLWFSLLMPFGVILMFGAVFYQLRKLRSIETLPNDPIKSRRKDIKSLQTDQETVLRDFNNYGRRKRP